MSLDTLTAPDAPPKPLFGVEHIRPHCAEILFPGRVKKADLSWGFRLCRADFISSHDYRRPFPGNWAEAPGPILGHNGECCNAVGDGICAARSLSGACSNGARLASSVGLLVAWTAPDLLGQSAEKVRLKRAWVSAIFDPITALKAASESADLSWADLRWATYTQGTLFPEGFDVSKSGAVKV